MLFVVLDIERKQPFYILSPPDPCTREIITNTIINQIRKRAHSDYGNAHAKNQAEITPETSAEEQERAGKDRDD